jgi:hypothetical protein
MASFLRAADRPFPTMPLVRNDGKVTGGQCVGGRG